MGRTILCTIHQPSSFIFNLFDKVIVLSEGGVVYNGPPNGVGKHINSIGYEPTVLSELPRFYINLFHLITLSYKMPPFVNPADFIMKLVQVPKIVSAEQDGEAVDPEGGQSMLAQKSGANKEQIKALVAAYDKSDMAKTAKNPPPAPSAVRLTSWTSLILFQCLTSQPIDLLGKEGPNCMRGPYQLNYFRQFVLLSQRSWLTIVREPMLFRVRYDSTDLAIIASFLSNLHPPHPSHPPQHLSSHLHCCIGWSHLPPPQQPPNGAE